jgi:hypothetical protein
MTNQATVSRHTREWSAEQQLLLRRTIAENTRENYSPSGIDVGIDLSNDRCTSLKTQEGVHQVSFTKPGTKPDEVDVWQPVLATCPICPLNEASENTFPPLSHLADSPEGGIESNCIHLLIFKKGVTYTVPGILTFIKRLTSNGLQSLHRRFH